MDAEGSDNLRILSGILSVTEAEGGVIFVGSKPLGDHLSAWEGREVRVEIGQERIVIRLREIRTFKYKDGLHLEDVVKGRDRQDG